MKRTLVEKELLDVPSEATRAEVERNLADIATANRWLGGTQMMLGHLSHLICPQATGMPVRILDMATGGADIPIAIVQWARKAGLSVQITAVDVNPMVEEIARENTQDYPEICVDKQNILSLPYADQAFDFVICAQVLHHLANDEVITALREANRLSSKGIVVSDLRRRALCVNLARLASPFISNRLSRHDSKVSFQNGFTPDELRELAESAELPNYAIYAHGPCRLALVVDKRTIIRAPAKKPAIAIYRAMVMC